MGAEFARFLVGGLVNTFATYALYLTLLTVLDYWLAYTATYVSGILLAYWIGLRFVFRERGSWHKLGQFPLVYGVQYLLGVTVVVVGVEGFGVPAALAPIAAVAVSIPVTFLLSRWILTDGSAGHRVAEEATPDPSHAEKLDSD
jgi:putative flippase GtrA